MRVHLVSPHPFGPSSMRLPKLPMSESEPHADGDTAQAGEAIVATAASHAVRRRSRHVKRGGSRAAAEEVVFVASLAF